MPIWSISEMDPSNGSPQQPEHIRDEMKAFERKQCPAGHHQRRFPLFLGWHWMLADPESLNPNPL
jgi:hypothetical protein